MNNCRPIPKDQLIMGVHAIREVLKHAPERLLSVYTSLSRNAEARKHELLLDCEKRRIPIQSASNDTLTKLVDSDSHQSFVARLKPRSYLEVRPFLDALGDDDNAFVLMLDQIFDPQNFGALLRSAECFGVDAVAWSKNRGCDLTALAAKTSCGASELLNLLRVSNLADACDKFKQAGFEIVAALADPGAEPLDEMTYAPRTVLIVGSEGEGIQPLLQKKADRAVYIRLTGKIESLNVAQATAVLLSKKN